MRKDVADGNAAEGFSTDGFVEAETVFVNAAGIFSARFGSEMFAWIAFDDAATGAAAGAGLFPVEVLLFLQTEIPGFVVERGIWVWIGIVH